MKIGEKIAKYRKDKMLTQEELAELMNVSRQTIYKWENDLSKPTLDNIKHLIEIFGISYDEFFS